MNGAVSAAAANALGRFGAAAKDVGPELARAALTGNVHARQTALRALTMILPPDAAKFLATGLHDAEVVVRRQASAGLSKIVSPPLEIVPDLLDALNDPDPRVRANVLTTLARVDPFPTQAEDVIVSQASSPSVAVRRSVAVALAHVESTQSRGVLQILAEDSNARVKQAAGTSLAVLDSKSVQVLENEIIALPAETEASPPAVEVTLSPSGELTPQTDEFTARA